MLKTPLKMLTDAGFAAKSVVENRFVPKFSTGSGKLSTKRGVEIPRARAENGKKKGENREKFSVSDKIRPGPKGGGEGRKGEERARGSKKVGRLRK